MTRPAADAPLDLYDPDAAAAPGVFVIAWKRKALVLLGPVLGLVLGGLYFAQHPPVYQSSAQVLVIKKQPDALPIQGLEGRQPLTEDFLSTHIALIRSPAILSRAVAKAKLESLRSLSGAGDPEQALAKALTAVRDSKDPGGASNVMNLSYRGPVPDECEAVLAAVIASYKDFLDETYRNVGDDAISLLTDAGEKLRKELTTTKAAQAEYVRKNPRTPEEQNLTGSQAKSLAVMEERLAALLVRKAEVVGRLDALEAAVREGRDPTPLLEIPLESPLAAAGAGRLGTGVAPAGLEETLLPLVVQEQALLENYGPDHPDVHTVRTKIRLTRELFNNRQRLDRAAADENGGRKPAAKEAVAAALAALRQQRDEIQLVEKSLAGLFDREFAAAQRAAGHERQLRTFDEKIKDAEATQRSLVKRLLEVDLVKDHGGYKVSVIAPARRGVKVEPKPVPIFGMALVAGLLLGLGLAWLAEVSDKSFRTPQEIRRRLGVPVIGHVPVLKPAEAGASALDPYLVAFHRPKSVEAEAYRGVRTAVYFSAEAGGHKVIQVTSPHASDGKTTLAANLAVSIAQSGKRVVLLDADFRRPRVHKLFGVPSGVGLASVLSGEADLRQALLPTEVPNLSVMPCGPRPSNPAELLTSPKLEAVFEALRGQFDFVLVDTPPLLAVSDPAVVAPQVDAVLLTIRVAKNGRPHAERAKEILAALKADPLGVIVNGAGRTGASGYQSAHYNYGYSYAYGYTYEAANTGNYYTDDAPSSEPELRLPEPAAAPAPPPRAAAPVAPSPRAAATPAAHPARRVPAPPGPPGLPRRPVAPTPSLPDASVEAPGDEPPARPDPNVHPVDAASKTMRRLQQQLQRQGGRAPRTGLFRRLLGRWMK